MSTTQAHPLVKFTRACERTRVVDVYARLLHLLTACRGHGVIRLRRPGRDA
jgi:hypothetical protein